MERPKKRQNCLKLSGSSAKNLQFFSAEVSAYGVLTWEEYEQIGRLEGVISNLAESVFQDLPEKARKSFPKVIRHLVNISETGEFTRIWAPVSTFKRYPQSQSLIEAFAGARLFVMDNSVNAESTVSIAHDTLLKHWHQLKQLLNHLSNRKARSRIRKLQVTIMAMATLLITSIGGILVAVNFARKADRSAEVAEARFNDVHKLANHLIFDVHDVVQNLYGSTPAQELIVKKGIDYLQRLEKNADEAPLLQGDIAFGYIKIGDIQSALGQTQKALDAYQKSFDIAKKLADSDPSNTSWQQNLAVSFNKVGEILEKKDQTQKALENFYKSLKILEKLTALNPKNVQTQRDLAKSYRRMGKLLAQEGKTELKKNPVFSQKSDPTAVDFSNLAWYLLTVETEELQNPKKVLDYAQ